MLSFIFIVGMDKVDNLFGYISEVEYRGERV